MNHELHQLIRKAKRGDDEAFEELVYRFKGRVYRQAYGMVNDHMEAEDISQEAFLKAYYSLPRLDSEYAFTSWLAKIVFHICYDRIGKRKKIREQGIEYLEELPEITGSMEQNDMRLMIEEGMQRISIEHREAIILSNIYGFSYDEMAEILNIPIGTVKSRIHAARLGLRKELQERKR